MNEPISPYARPTGIGTAMVTWTAPASPVDRYEFLASLTLNGFYEKFPAAVEGGNKAFVFNLPVNQIVYMKMRSVTDEISSSDVQIKQASPQTGQTVLMAVRGVKDHKIPLGATFATPDFFGSLFVVQSLEEIVL